MRSYQTEIKKNAGFTLVEIMVVILIIALLLLVGNYGDISKRREKAKLEEIAVEIIGLIDQEKVNTLLGKTEQGAIVRKRKIEININIANETLTYNSYADLVEDPEGSYCSVPGNECLPGPPIINNGNDTALTTRSWELNQLTMSLYNCDTLGTIIGAPAATLLTTILQGDTMNFSDTDTSSVKHIVIQISRLNSYREIHIDRRTGVTYEREGIATVSCI